MKKFFNKKILIISLGLLFLITVIPILITVIPIITMPQTSQADVAPLPFFKSTSTVTIANVQTQGGTTTIVNLSDKDYFIPNKSTPEWYAFEANTPQYVTVSRCGDYVKGIGETTNNCPTDAGTGASYCGDGVCDVNPSTLVLEHYDPPRQDIAYDKVCKIKTNGWLFVPIVGIIVAASGNAFKVTCHDVAKTVDVYYEGASRRKMGSFSSRANYL